MDPVNILDARNNLSQLIAAAVDSEEVIIAKRGRPAVRLVAVESATESALEASVRLEAIHVSLTSHRTAAQLDQQIADERAGWE